MFNQTINYYNQNASAYTSSTVSVDFSEKQDKFLSCLHAGDCILDFGCGSGRDTKYFLEKGFRVDATDGSEELCKIAREHIGIAVRQILFQELDALETYDGIWACSSILHLSKEELKPVLRKMLDALKKDGVIYTSFKYSTFEGERNGRYFTDFTENTFAEFVKDIDDLKIEEMWITGDVRPDRGSEQWLNIIIRKQNIR